MHSLPLFHRIAGQPVIVVGEGEMAAAKVRLVERAGGQVVGADHTEARLAFVAIEGPEAIAATLKARGVLVNVADRPDLCDFTLPSVLERGPVLIVVSTGGVSAGLAKALRMRLDRILPQSLGSLAEALGAARERIRMLWPNPAQRRKMIDEAMAPAGPADPLREFQPDVFESWLDANSTGGFIGYLSKIELTLASADPDDLTLREARWIADADTIIYDPDVAPAILALARADSGRYLVGAELPQTYGPLTVILRSR